MTDESTAYTFITSIWTDADGDVSYYAAQSFDEKADEIIVHGVAQDWQDAKKQIRSAIQEVFN